MIKLEEPVELPESTFVLQRPCFQDHYGPPSDLVEVPSDLWAKPKSHVGLLYMPLRRVTLKANAKLRMIQQYLFSIINGIDKLIQMLLDLGLLVENNSLCNTLILLTV